MDAKLKNKIGIIAEGLKYQKKLQDVQSGKHFEQKYNLDYQFDQEVKKTLGLKKNEEVKKEEKRQRDIKAEEKNQKRTLLMFKYL